MIHSVNANSLKSHSVVHSGHHKNMISDFATDNSYWRSVHYSVRRVRVVLLYEARVANSLWGNHRLHCSIYGRAHGAHSQTPAHRGPLAPHITSYQCCLSFHQHNGYHKLLIFL